jgi:hypothetical protein
LISRFNMRRGTQQPLQTFLSSSLTRHCSSTGLRLSARPLRHYHSSLGLGNRLTNKSSHFGVLRTCRRHQHQQAEPEGSRSAKAYEEKYSAPYRKKPQRSRWALWLIGVPLSFKLGYDMANSTPVIKQHWEQEANLATDIWNAVGYNVFEKLRDNKNVEEVLGKDSLSPQRVKIHDTIKITESTLGLESRVGSGGSSLTELLNNTWLILVKKDVKLQVPINVVAEGKGEKEVLLCMEVESATDTGGKWTVRRAWVQTDDACVEVN